MLIQQAGYTKLNTPLNFQRTCSFAVEAISHAGTAIGILGSEGIVIAAEKKVTSKLLEQSSTSEKIYVLNDNMICGVAGITSDANTLITYAQQAAQRYLFAYGEDIPAEQLVQSLCDLKQGYTQYGGLRPFGVSFVFAGWDHHHGFQLYASDPSGNYGGWKATCIGANNAAAQSLLKQDYVDGMPLKDAIGLAVKVLSKSMDSTTLSSDKLEFATLRLVDGRPVYHMYAPKEIDLLLKEHKAVNESEEGKKPDI